MPNLSQQIALTGNCFRTPKKSPSPKGRIKHASSKRAKQLKEYGAKRKAFLMAHPFCMVSHIIFGGFPDYVKSEDIHHRAGRIGDKLLDENDWLAVSRIAHNWIHRNPSTARKLGLLR